MKKNGTKIILSGLTALLLLSACGKKAPLRPPGSDQPPVEEPVEDDLDDFFDEE